MKLWKNQLKNSTPQSVTREIHDQNRPGPGGDEGPRAENDYAADQDCGERIALRIKADARDNSAGRFIPAPALANVGSLAASPVFTWNRWGTRVQMSRPNLAA